MMNEEPPTRAEAEEEAALARVGAARRIAEFRERFPEIAGTNPWDDPASIALYRRSPF